MPKEFELLSKRPPALQQCPRCRDFYPGFMRGQVQSTWRRLLGLRYCAVICHICKEIVGWEKP